MKRQVFIAHAEGEQAEAEKLAKRLQKAGYEVAHYGTVLVGESIVEAAQKVLEVGGPVVICATVRAVGTRWAHRIANAARTSTHGHVFVVQMEEEAFVESISLGEKVATWWKDPAAAARQLLESLQRYYPLTEDSAAAALLHDAERRYRQLALEACDIINLSNLPEGERYIATRKLELRRLYVPLRVKVAVPSEDELSQARMEALERQREAWMSGGAPTDLAQERFPVGERLARSGRLVVLGDPGAGKSTLLRWLATAYILRLKEDVEWKDLPDIATLPAREWLPILIRCRDLDPRTIGGPLDDVLRHTLRKSEMSEEESESLRAVLRHKLAEGQALLLIDGLDEISETGARIRFCEQVEQIHRAFPAAPIVVTSRIVGYRELGGQRIGRGFEHVTVDDLSPEDKDDFVHRWCAVTEPPERRATTVQEFIRDIHSTDRIEHLTGNPMLLTTMALVKRKVGKLPRRRADLYWEAVQVLLNWRSAETEDPLALWEALPQLEFLAYAMCERGVQRLRRDEVMRLLDQIRDEYPNLHAVRNHTPDQFLKLIERRTGILVESGHEKHLGMTVPIYEFRHLTFQEYLAARALVERCFPHAPMLPLAKYLAPLASKFEFTESPEPTIRWTTNWPEVLRLCVAICLNDDVDKALLAILEPLPGENPELTTSMRALQAAACLEDEPNASDEVARKILLRLTSQIESHNENEIGTWGWQRMFSPLWETRWAGELMRSFAHEFQRRDPIARSFIWEIWHGYYVTWSTPGEEPSRVNFTPYLSSLSASDDLEVITAARRLSNTRWHSAGSLQSIDGDVLVALVERGGAVSDAAARTLSSLWFMDAPNPIWRPTPAQVERLLSVLDTEAVDVGAAIHLMNFLGRYGVRAAVAPIISRLKHDEPMVRREAATALGELRDARALEPLLQSTRDTEAMVRQEAATALGKVAEPAAVGALHAMLQEPIHTVRAAAAGALCAFQGPEARAALRDAAKDPIEDVRREVLWRLSARKSPDDAELLVLFLDDPYMRVRCEAARSLGSMRERMAVEPLLDLLRQRRAPLNDDDFIPMSNRGHGFFAGPFMDERLPLVEAALALGEIGDQRAIAPLRAIHDEVDAGVRPAIIHSLGMLGGGCTIEWLLPMLQAPESPIQLAAAEALARLGDERGRELLLQKLASDSAQERTSALELLAGLYQKHEVDLRLLLIFEYRETVFMDPAEVVDEARLQQLLEQMEIAPDEARRGFEALTQRIPLKLKWQLQA
ncbi:PBS lyase HEAT-like repeat-containing protein [Stigmatella aurantiaca]|uniref:PBS lyase HEAT-like repeat-containing protein n=1 Tax=Stigmatella aurantiaca TaxID=41 RepID=A0A1H7RPG2_STIAU|nr:HEAT repeat domain-containing protein [Stigmatella aurantiaca]SEL61888.1 PBS lyase HEAT-like repeat-containing protein [Stigmatella aurantiaca]